MLRFTGTVFHKLVHLGRRRSRGRSDRSRELWGRIDGFMGRRSGFTFCKYEEIEYKVLNYLNSIKR